jgi:multisubunit Na+/H+ antiporter MnhC subunit
MFPFGLTTGGLRLSLLVTVALLFGAGCSVPSRYTVSFKDGKGVKIGADVKYRDRAIGKVAYIRQNDKANTTDMVLSVDRSLSRFVKTESCFILRPNNGTHGTYIELLVTNPDSPLLSPGSRVIGAESDMELTIRQIKTNWRKNLIVIAVGIFAVFALMSVFRFLIKLGGVVTALVCSMFGANYSYRPVAGILGTYIPADYRPDIVAFVLTAVVIYFAVAILFWLLLAPFKKTL